MSLERSIILSVILVLLASLLVGAGLTYEHAVAKVHTEMDAAVAVGRRIVQNAADDEEEQISPARRLNLIVGDFNGDRHLLALLRDPSGKITTMSTLQPPDDPAPEIFFDLVSGQPVTVNVDLSPRLRAAGTLSIQTDAHNEVSEAWDDLKLSLTVIGVFFCLVMALTLRTLRVALRPLRLLSAAMTEVGTGNYEARLAWRNYRELEALKSGFNAMAAQLSRTEEENRLLQTRVKHVQEDERSELARDLHDEVAPFLFTVSADAALIRQNVLGKDLPAIDARAIGILTSVGHMQRHLSGVLSRLRQDVLLDLGLAGAIDALVHFWRARRPEIAFNIDIEEDPSDERCCGVIFRVVQESLNNAMRHAEASSVELRVQHGEEGFEVTITDNGHGLRQGTSSQGLGLLGMRERVLALGGVLEVRNRESEHGVVVRATLPDQAAAMVLS